MTFEKNEEKKPKLAVDAMLGNIAKKLRILGFDTWYSSDIADDILLQMALNENRILITRDVLLFQKALKRKMSNAILISTELEQDQLVQIKNKLNLKKFMIIMNRVRCSICNERLIPISKKEDSISKYVPKNIFERFNAFWKCLNCNRIYWEGTHINNFQKLVDDVNERSK